MPAFAGVVRGEYPWLASMLGIIGSVVAEEVTRNKFHKAQQKAALEI